MKTLIAILLFATALVVADEMTCLRLTVSGAADHKYDLTEARANMKRACGGASSTVCSLIVIERDGRILARMDLDGNWIPMAERDEIADVIATAVKPQ